MQVAATRPRLPWVRGTLAAVCLLAAIGVDDGSSRVGWLMLGGGLAGWAAWDVMHPKRQNLSYLPHNRSLTVTFQF